MDSSSEISDYRTWVVDTPLVDHLVWCWYQPTGEHPVFDAFESFDWICLHRKVFSTRDRTFEMTSADKCGSAAMLSTSWWRQPMRYHCDYRLRTRLKQLSLLTSPSSKHYVSGSSSLLVPTVGPDDLTLE